MLKLWSKNGVLWSEIAKTESPSYAIAWSPDNNFIAFGNGKNVVFKSIKPGVVDVTIWGTEIGVVTVISWSNIENLILIAGEDCRY